MMCSVDIWRSLSRIGREYLDSPMDCAVGISDSFFDVEFEIGDF